MLKYVAGFSGRVGSRGVLWTPQVSTALLSTHVRHEHHVLYFCAATLQCTCDESSYLFVSHGSFSWRNHFPIPILDCFTSNERRNDSAQFQLDLKLCHCHTQTFTQFVFTQSEVRASEANTFPAMPKVLPLRFFLHFFFKTVNSICETQGKHCEGHPRTNMPYQI